MGGITLAFISSTPSPRPSLSETSYESRHRTHRPPSRLSVGEHEHLNRAFTDESCNLQRSQSDNEPDEPGCLTRLQYHWADFRSKHLQCLETRSEYSLFIFSPTNRLRVLCRNLCEHPQFDNVVLAFIVLNCISITFERPSLPRDSWQHLFVTYINYVFTFVFGMEMLIKVLAKGMTLGENTYLKVGWV